MKKINAIAHMIQFNCIKASRQRKLSVGKSFKIFACRLLRQNQFDLRAGYYLCGQGASASQKVEFRYQSL